MATKLNVSEIHEKVQAWELGALFGPFEASSVSYDPKKHTAVITVPDTKVDEAVKATHNKELYGKKIVVSAGDSAPEKGAKKEETPSKSKGLAASYLPHADRNGKFHLHIKTFSDGRPVAKIITINAYGNELVGQKLRSNETVTSSILVAATDEFGDAFTSFAFANPELKRCPVGISTDTDRIEILIRR